MKHDLKINHNFFEEILNEQKKFEIRFNDRNYKADDVLLLNEIKNGERTGRKLPVLAYKIYHEYPGLKPGYVMIYFHIL